MKKLVFTSIVLVLVTFGCSVYPTFLSKPDMISNRGGTNDNRLVGTKTTKVSHPNSPPIEHTWRPPIST